MERDRHWTYPRRRSPRGVDPRRRTEEAAAPPRQRQSRRSRPRHRRARRLSGEWAAENPRPDGRAWEVAVLTFYRGQEAALRERLQSLFRQHGNFHNFDDWKRLRVSLCTVDRFQGHEADLVLLSFVKTRSVGFLNSPNRLNVALTRARYQIVLIGHHAYFASDRCRSLLLRALADSDHYSHDITWSTP